LKFSAKSNAKSPRNLVDGMEAIWAIVSNVSGSSSMVGIWYKISSFASQLTATCAVGARENVIVRGYSLGVVGGVGEDQESGELVYRSPADVGSA